MPFATNQTTALADVLAYRNPGVVRRYAKDYAAFCDRYFGIFLHHVPEADEAGTPPDDAVVHRQLETQFALVYDVLGEETLIRWHDHFRYASTKPRQAKS
jgi:hypothetical protein